MTIIPARIPQRPNRWALRLAWKALMNGRYTSWDFQPHTDASRQYARNHLDLDEVEASRRFPPA